MDTAVPADKIQTADHGIPGQLVQYFICQLRIRFDIQIKRDGFRHFFRRDFRAVPFDHPVLFHLIHAFFHGDPGQTDFFSDVRIGHSGIVCDHFQDAVVHLIQTFYLHQILLFPIIDVDFDNDIVTGRKCGCKITFYKTKSKNSDMYHFQLKQYISEPFNIIITF